MGSIISGCGKFNRSKDKDLIEARSALVQAWKDDVERAFEKVDKNLPDMMASYIADLCYRESEQLKKQITMERKIGEIFNIDNEWYQVVKSNSECCKGCAFYGKGGKAKCADVGSCGTSREDRTQVIFKKLEKVGKPFVIEKVLYQHYKVFDIDNVYGDGFFWCVHNYKARTLTIEIKQNQEDMGENKLNLKPFDIQKAREGKPVCTRDGRKARIICFDAKDTQPIIGLYEKNIDGIVREYLCSYHTDGRMYDDQDTGYDLMMLPEKKEGWVNVYDADTTFYFVEGMVYNTKEEAIKHINPDNEIYTTTVKIEWEE